MAPALAIFAPLLGRCFVATLAPDTVDRHCFTAVYEGAHVRDTHVVTAKGKAVYSGESLYSVDAKGLEFIYFNSMGGVGHGNATVGSGTLAYPGSIRATPADKPQPMGGKWIITSDGYDAANEGQPVRRFRLSR